MSDLLTANEVCALIGTSVYTLDTWYKFKRLYPDNEYAKILPEIVRLCGSRTRYWNREDIGKLLEFKVKIPHGKNGILGDVTQKYVRKAKQKGTKKNGKSKVN